MNCTRCPSPLIVHYAPGILAVLKRVSPDFQAPVADSRGLKMNSMGASRDPFVIAGVSLLKPGEQSWVLERSWIPKGGENHGQQQGQWEEAPENRSTTV